VKVKQDLDFFCCKTGSINNSDPEWKVSNIIQMYDCHPCIKMHFHTLEIFKERIRVYRTANLSLSNG
jgi:hypothetical protein